MTWCCLPFVHQAQLALIWHDPVHLLVRARSDLVWVPATSLIGFPVPLCQQVWRPTADAGLPCLTVAGLTGTLGASSPMMVPVRHNGAPSVPTGATPPGCLDVAACSDSLWCPVPIGLPVPLRSHLWVVVGQVVAGAHCSASIVGAARAICAMLDCSLPPVWLPSFAHAAPPPGLPAAPGPNDDLAQVDVGRMVPFLLQVWS